MMAGKESPSVDKQSAPIREINSSRSGITTANTTKYKTTN